MVKRIEKHKWIMISKHSRDDKVEIKSKEHWRRIIGRKYDCDEKEVDFLTVREKKKEKTTSVEFG